MRVWAIETKEDWLRAGDRAFVSQAVPDPQLAHPEEWLWRQLISHLGPPSHSVRSPVYVWVQYESAIKPRPDLRSSWHLEKGVTGVRVELDLDEQDLLLFDSELWCLTLNRSYIPEDEQDAEQFETWALEELGKEADKNARWQSPAYRDRVVESWTKMFDLDWESPGYAAKREQTTILGATWLLPLNRVVSVREFTAR